MNNEQLHLLCNGILELKPHFIGVFAYDQLTKPATLERDKFCIVNFDPSYKDGSHWVTIIFRSKGRKNIYFDSYGRPPPPEKHIFHHVLGKCFDWNNVPLQHPFSTACGQWCIFFCCAFFSGNSLCKISEHFSEESDLLKNDFAINQFVNDLLTDDELYKVIDRDFLKKQFAVALK